jgi:phosphate transport system substrate-binding protein
LRVAIALCAASLGAALAASTVGEIPGYTPLSIPFPKGASYVTPDGAISITGYNDMQDLLEVTDRLFAAAHPGFRFALDLKGTKAAPAALARGSSAFAPMGAAFTPGQLRDYVRATPGQPLAVRVAHGSLSPNARSGPILVFVHPSNPVERLTLDQAAALFASGDSPPGAPNEWGRLGLKGSWMGKPVHPVGLSADTPIGDFMRDRMGGRPFCAEFRPEAQSEAVVRQVAADPLAIGFARANVVDRSVKVLAVAQRRGSPYSKGSANDIAAGRYPFDWYLYIYVRTVPGRPIDPFVREYLRLVLSREGQQAVAATPQAYIPLTPGEAAAELAKLN